MNKSDFVGVMEYKLSDLFALQMGKTPARDEPRYWQNGSHSWISIADLSSVDKFIEETKESISDCAVKESNISKIPENTVVMSFKLSLGKVAITKKAMYSNEAIMAFIPKAGVDISTDYLYYLLKARKWDTGGNKAVKGITLNKATLSNVKVCIHSAKEQRQIVNILDKLKSVIKRRQAQLSKLDELVKCRFVELFGDPESESSKWKKVPLSTLCSSIVRGPFGSALKKEYFVPKAENTVKVYEQKNAIEQSHCIGCYYVSNDKYLELKRFECKSGDFIMSCSGTIGKIYQLPQEAELGIINQALCKFTLNTNILPEVFLTFMRHSISILETKGSGIQNIGAVSYIKNIGVPLAPMQIQQYFSAFVRRIDKLRVSIQKSLDKTQQLFDSLMQEYFD